MLSVIDEFNLKSKGLLQDGDIGLEIEVEGDGLPTLYRSKYWRTEMDGSLRGESAEWVLRRPLNLADLKSALNSLDKAYIDAETNVHESVRAGVHVHVNCQGMSMVELYNFFTLYIVLENVLIKYCGENREGNLFCLRCQDAEYLIYQLINAARTGHFSKIFFNDDLRYASMNVKALAQYGSLEFRAMRGTRDLDAIYNWASILYNLREKAKEFESPIEIIEQVSKVGCGEFLGNCLGDFNKEFMNYEIDNLVYEGIRLGQCIAYSTKWEDWKKEIKFIQIGNLKFKIPNGDVDLIIDPEEDF